MEETDKSKEIRGYSSEVGEKVVASARRSLIEKRPGWRSKMAAIALAGTLLFTSACGFAPTGNASPTPETQPTATVTGQERIDEANLRWADFLEIGFPMRSYGLEPKSAEKIDTNIEVPTIVANYTDLNIDTEVASGIYKTIDQLKDNSSLVRDMRYDYNGKIYRFKVVPREYLYRGVSVIPNAEGLPEDMKLITAQTAHITIGNGNHLEVSYVRTADEGDLHTNEVRLATEACQASYWFLPVEVETGNQPEDDISLDVAQELGCNSLGTAVGFKANGVPYPEYKAHIESTLFNTEGANGFKQILMDEQSYNTLPVFGTLLK